MRRKTAARALALQALYQYDLRGTAFLAEVEAFFQASAKSSEDVALADDLFQGCVAYQAQLDARIAEIAQHWEVARMAAVDRAILRLGAYELLYTPDVPPKVAVNEAVRLAKRFSTRESGAFVNGILDKLMTPRAPLPAPEKG